jgi:fructokinase
MEKKYYLGLDVGGTKVEGAIAELHTNDRSIKVFSKKRMAVNSKGTADEFVGTLVILIKDLLSEAKFSLTNIKAIGIGLPRSLDPKTKIMMNGNTQFLIGYDVINALKNKLNSNLPIFAQNDANLFTLAEAWGGAGKKFYQEKHIPFEEQVAVGITLGTGVGGGLVSLGEIYNGAHGSGLEVGHIALHPEGHECYCGQKGCAETYLSGTALNKIGNAKEIFDKAEKGDVEACKILEIYRKNFIHFLSILNNLFNPHYFVFGGGLSSQKSLFKDLKSDLENNIFLAKKFCPEIYINQLGDSSGLFGAMIYAQELLNS